MWIILIIFMVIFSIYLSIKLKFKNYRLNIKELIKKDKTALFLALGTKIGVGSVIGTASSIIIGGFSSVIWILFFSFITTSLTYYESYYGSIYKKKSKDSYIGGPYFIIRYGLNNKVLSIISIVILILLYSFLFQMIQVNTIYNMFKNIHNINNLYIFFAILTLLLITIRLSISEVKKIMNIIVPIKCLLFILICLIGIIVHHNELLMSFKLELKSLFTFKSIFSGFLIGTIRSMFMNEILIGTTSISSGSDNNNVETSIKYQLLAVYFITLMNTLLITSLILIYKYNHNIISDYNLLVTNMFYYIGGKFSLYVLLIIITLFALTTLLSGYYILKSNIEYLFNNKQVTNISSILFIIIVISSIFINSNYLWKYTDILIFVMILINSYCIIKLMRK